MTRQEGLENMCRARPRAGNARCLFLRVGLSLLLGWSTAEVRAQTPYAVQLLPVGDATEGVALGINRTGEIVGYVYFAPLGPGTPGFPFGTQMPASWRPNATVPTLLPVPSSDPPLRGTAQGISDSGQIVGRIDSFPFPLAQTQPTFWEGPEAIAPTSLPYPTIPPRLQFGTGGGPALSINKRGQIVGAVFKPGLLIPEFQPAFWTGQDATAPTILPFPSVPPSLFGSGGGAALSINDRAQIVGTVQETGLNAPTLVPAFWEDPGATAPTILSLPAVPPPPFGISQAVASSISDNGEIVGWVSGRPVFWKGADDPTPVLLPFPSFPPGSFLFPGGGAAFSINKKSQIVGYVFTFQPKFPFVTEVPAVWESPAAVAPTLLPFPPGPFTLSGFALSINDNGQIVGYVQGPGGNRPVMWTRQ